MGKKQKKADELIQNTHPNIIDDHSCIIAAEQREHIEHTKSKTSGKIFGKTILGIGLVIAGLVAGLKQLPTNEALQVCSKDQTAVDYLLNTDYETSAEYDNLYNDDYVATSLNDEDTYVIFEDKTGNQGQNVILHVDQDMFDQLQPGDCVYYNTKTHILSPSAATYNNAYIFYAGWAMAILGGILASQGILLGIGLTQSYWISVPLSTKLLSAWAKHHMGYVLILPTITGALTALIISCGLSMTHPKLEEYSYSIGYVDNVYQETPEELATYATNMTVQEGVPFQNYRYVFDNEGHMSTQLLYYGDFLKSGSYSGGTYNLDRISIDEATYQQLADYLSKSQNDTDEQQYGVDWSSILGNTTSTDNISVSTLYNTIFTLHSTTKDFCSANNAYTLQLTNAVPYDAFSAETVFLILAIHIIISCLGVYALTSMSGHEGLYRLWVQLGKECELPIEIINASYERISNDLDYAFQYSPDAVYFPPSKEPETDIALDEPQTKAKLDEKPGGLTHAYDPKMLMSLSPEDQSKALLITEDDNLQTVIFKIRGLNDLIPDDQNLSDLLYSLEDTVTKIKNNPDIKADNADVSRARRLALPEISVLLLKYVFMCSHYQNSSSNRTAIINSLDEEISKVVRIVDNALISAETSALENESRETLASAKALQQLYGDQL